MSRSKGPKPRLFDSCKKVTWEESEGGGWAKTPESHLLEYLCMTARPLTDLFLLHSSLDSGGFSGVF